MSETSNRTLLDNRRIRERLGVTKAAATSIMTKLPTVRVPGLDKTYVRETDLLRLLDESTSEGHWVFEKTGVR